MKPLNDNEIVQEVSRRTGVEPAKIRYILNRFFGTKGFPFLFRGRTFMIYAVGFFRPSRMFKGYYDRIVIADKIRIRFNAQKKYRNKKVINKT